MCVCACVFFWTSSKLNESELKGFKSVNVGWDWVLYMFFVSSDCFCCTDTCRDMLNILNYFIEELIYDLHISLCSL